MAQQHINLGNPNLGDGDALRDAMVKAQANFTDLYGAIEPVVRPESFRDCSDPVLFAVAMREAAEHLAGKYGRGTIQLGPRTYTITAHPDATAGTNEGTALIIGSGMDGITIQGMGRGITRIRPVTNKIEIIRQDGGNGLRVEGIEFDNSLNGLLQGMPKVGTPEIGGGVDGWGNPANAAIRQVRGDTLTLQGNSFRDFTIATDFRGNFDDKSQLVGAFLVDDQLYDGCIFGNLVHQPKEFRATKLRCRNNKDSVNADASRDPGHLIYVTDRSGASPDLVLISDVMDTGGMSSALKVRKSKTLAMSNIVIKDSGRGVEVHRCEGGAVSNVYVKLKEIVEDSQQVAMLLSDCGPLQVSNALLDLRGVDAYGFQAAGESNDEPYQNKDWAAHGVRVINDYAGTTGKAPFFVQNQSDFELDGTFDHKGVIEGIRFPVDVRSSSSGQIHIRHKCTGDTPGNTKLVSFDALSNDNDVTVQPNDVPVVFSPGVSPDNSVYDLGTGNKVNLLAYREMNFSPTLTYTTPGDLSVAYVTQGGRLRYFQDRVEFDLRVQFTPTFTTAGGELRIHGLPYPSRLSSPINFYTLQLGRADFATLLTGENQMQAIMEDGETYIEMMVLRSGQSAKKANVSNFPSGQTYLINVSGSYPI